MKYKASPTMAYQQTCIPAWDLVFAAPVGSRVNFNVGASGSMAFENTLKAQMHPLMFTAHGLEPKTKKVWHYKDLIIELAKLTTVSNTMTWARAKQIVWIKEVAIFQHIPFPPHKAASHSHVVPRRKLGVA